MADERETFILANTQLRDVIDRIEPEHWDQSMPELTRGDDAHTLRAIINYHAYDEAWVPAMLEGRRMADVGPDEFGTPFGGEVLGAAPKRRFAQLSAAAIEAVRKVPADELDDRIVHFSYGDYPAREALRHITSFRGIRVHDLSQALGFEVRMSDDLVAGLWEMLEPRINAYREAGIFPPPVEVPEGAPLHDRLLGLTGRRP